MQTHQTTKQVETECIFDLSPVMHDLQRLVDLSSVMHDLQSLLDLSPVMHDLQSLVDLSSVMHDLESGGLVPCDARLAESSGLVPCDTRLAESGGLVSCDARLAVPSCPPATVLLSCNGLALLQPSCWPWFFTKICKVRIGCILNNPCHAQNMSKCFHKNLSTYRELDGFKSKVALKYTQQ